MKHNLFLILSVAASLVACSQKYYPEMYEKAGSEAPVVVKTEKDTVLHEPVMPVDTVLVKDTAEQVIDTVAANATIRETTDTYTSNGVAVQQQYHVVVGSFQSEVNAQNLLTDGSIDRTSVNGEGALQPPFYSPYRLAVWRGKELCKNHAETGRDIGSRSGCV